jgi:hypothetical protein
MYSIPRAKPKGGLREVEQAACRQRHAPAHRPSISWAVGGVMERCWKRGGNVPPSGNGTEDPGIEMPGGYGQRKDEAVGRVATR